MAGKIAYQGVPGAYSHLACRKFYPDHEPMACDSFALAFEAVTDGSANRAMIPVENTLAGRVADIHHLLPESSLEIEAEKFLPIHHQLLIRPDADEAGIRAAHSHPMALGQCRVALKDRGLRAVNAYDTAGAAQWLANEGGDTDAAIASELAAETYGLKIMAANIEDASHNTTRFLVMSPAQARVNHDPAQSYMTSFFFEVRNIPGALYKALGSFATNGVNMTKLESYQLGGKFTATRFYADIHGHPDEPHVAQALEELSFFCSHVRIVGAYLADPFRAKEN